LIEKVVSSLRVKDVIVDEPDCNTSIVPIIVFEVIF
jgi:hypothetical protein